MSKRLVPLSVSVFALSLLSTSARADDLFTLTYIPTSTVDTFSLPDSPTVSQSNGYSFTLDDVSVDASGTSVVEDLTFYDSINGGAFTMAPGPALYGPQLYTGTFANPTFLTGPYVLTDDIDPDYSLSIAAVDNSATPEPSSLLLLGTGIVGVASSLFNRRRTA